MANIIMFGGNGFIGYEVLTALLERSNVRITMINRGKSWEWGKKPVIESSPCVKLITWDRNHPLSECSELQSALETTEFNAVLDFSGYTKKHVKDAVKTLREKSKLYIYISSDSVYEVCTKGHSGLTKESDDVRPTAEEQVKRLKKRDSYGHKKLSCEECIHKHCHDMKFIILRLADVIGPRDSTDRWWQYQLWVKLSNYLNIPVLVPEELHSVQLSLVYVKDIARLICTVLQRNEFENLCNQAYNLAFKSSCTIEELLKLIKDSISKAKCPRTDTDTLNTDSGIAIEYSSNRNVPHIYPSVDKGPIEIDQALSTLNCQPTSLENAVFETVTFYETICGNQKFIEEKNDVCDALLKDLKKVYDSEIYDKVKKELKRILH